MSHPSLGLAPLDLHAGHPAAAAILRAATPRVAARALEAAVAADPTLRERYDDVQLRELLADLQAFVGRLAIAIAANEPRVMIGWAENIAVRYRKRVVPMDDVIGLCEGLREVVAGTIKPDAVESANAALDTAIKVFKWHRRLAGDGHRRNAFLAFIYKGA